MGKGTKIWQKERGGGVIRGDKTKEKFEWGWDRGTRNGMRGGGGLLK